MPYILGSGLFNYIDAIKADFGDPADISDDQYGNLIVKAIRRINFRIGTEFEYYPAGSGISPQPNENQADLILLQAECLLAKRIRATAVRKGIRVRDGDSEIDTTSSFSGHGNVVSDFCDELKEQITRYLINNSLHGDMIWYGNSRIIETHDHDGQADHWSDHESPFDGDWR